MYMHKHATCINIFSKTPCDFIVYVYFNVVTVITCNY